MIEIHTYRCSDGYWFADVPGACGSGLTAWAAIAEALTVWERRGRPLESPLAHHRGGADWIIESITPSGSAAYPYHVEGHNLNSAPGAYGRRICWNVRGFEDPRFEILPGAGEIPARSPGRAA